MRMRLGLFVGLLPGLLLVDRAASAAPLGGHIVEATSGDPVAGATVLVTPEDGAPRAATARTAADGGFAFDLPPGRYTIVAIYGDARWLRHGVEVDAQGGAALRGVLAIGAEDITIHEHVAPAQPAEVEKRSVKRILPYSEEAIDSDAWAVGWVLLDVDTDGRVESFRFLRRPGHGLDDIATGEVFALRFRPARDAQGRPVRSQLLWKLEWPSFYWAREIPRNRAHIGALTPPDVALGIEVAKAAAAASGSGAARAAARRMREGWGVSAVRLPPCRGSGPLDLDDPHAVYRDCSPPDFDKVLTEPPIRRP
jgi:hypothetical protein